MKKLLYIAFFLFAFVVSFYLTFPADALRPMLETQMASGMGPGSSVHIGNLSLWRLSGVSMSDMEFHMQNQSFKLAELKLRLGIWSTLKGHPKIIFDTHVYDGRASGFVTMNPKGGLSALDVDVSKINLAKIAEPGTEGGLKMTGLMNLNVDLNLGANPAKDGSGNLNLDFKNLSIGPGPMPIPGSFGGSMTIPEIKLGAFSGKGSFSKGKANIKDLKLAGGDVEAHVNANIELSDNILFSPLKGNGWFRLKSEFQKANPKIAMLLELSPDIKAAEESDGRIHFSLIGSLMAPTPKWGR